MSFLRLNVAQRMTTYRLLVGNNNKTTALRYSNGVGLEISSRSRKREKPKLGIRKMRMSLAEGVLGLLVARLLFRQNLVYSIVEWKS